MERDADQSSERQGMKHNDIHGKYESGKRMAIAR